MNSSIIYTQLLDTKTFLEEITFTFLTGRSHHARYGNIVNLDINQINTYAKESAISFEQAFSEVVSHEILHSVLFKYISKTAWDQLDNICAYKIEKLNQCQGYWDAIQTVQQSFKQWFGGLYKGKP